MKAAFVPAANSRWEVKQTETPEPEPSQVLIKIHASGLCDNAQDRRPHRRSVGSAYVRPLRVVRPQQANVLWASYRHRYADGRRPC
jgi:hypothetical protein